MNIQEHFSGNELHVINTIVKQAELYIHELGSFYPFGTIMTNEGEVKPVSGYTGKEHPEHYELISLLQNAFEDKVAQGIYKLAIICVDIFVNHEINGQKVKKDALELRILSENNEWKNYYITYIINDEKNIKFFKLY